MTEKDTCDQVGGLAREVSAEAKPSGSAAPMEFLLLESRDGFPAGKAPARMCGSVPRRRY